MTLATQKDTTAIQLLMNELFVSSILLSPHICMLKNECVW